MEDQVMNDLVDLQICANSIPQDYDFRFEELDESFSTQAKELQERTFNLYKNLSDYISGGSLEVTEQSMDFVTDKLVNLLLNTPEMNVLDKKTPESEPKTQQKIESRMFDDIEFIYAPVQSKPGKFILDPNIEVPDSLPGVSSIDFKLPDSFPSDINIKNITYVKDDKEASPIISFIRSQYPNGPLYMAVQKHRIMSYRPFPCLIVIMTPNNQIYIFDTLSLKASLPDLKGILSNSNILKIIYEYQCSPTENDVQLIAENLGVFTFPVMNICENEALENRINGDFPKVIVDWRLRPLSERLLLIAAKSVFHLPFLLSTYIVSYKLPQIQELNLIYAQKPMIPYHYDEEEKIKDINEIIPNLDPDDQSFKILDELLKLRDQVAQMEDQSPSLIFSNSSMKSIAIEKPQTIESLTNLLDDSLITYANAYKYDILYIVRQISNTSTQNVFNMIQPRKL